MKQDNNETSFCVLIKNENNALPIAKEAKKAGLIGIHSYRTICSAAQQADGSPRISLADAFQAEGFRMNGRAVETYEAYAENPKYRIEAPRKCFLSKRNRLQAYKEFAMFSEDAVHNVVDLSDVIIFTIGREVAPGQQYTKEKGSYFLSDGEMEVLRSVARRCMVKEKHLIVVLNVAHPIDLDSWRDMADAILYIGTPQPDAAKQVVDVIRGLVKPADTLPAEWLSK